MNKIKTEYFTYGVGRQFEQMAQRLKREFEATNKVVMNVLPPEVIVDKQFPKGSHPCWITCWLWDYVEKDTERIVWLDADIDVMNPLDYLSDFPFAAVLDSGESIRRRQLLSNIFKDIKMYFNNGYFSTTREIENIWKMLRSEIRNPLQDTAPEQTWTNYYLLKYVNPTSIYILDEKYNYMCYANKNLNKPIPDNVVHVHHAGLVKPLLKGGEYMPISTFNAIETDNYRLSPTLLEVKKDFLNHRSGEQIFADNNVSAKIIETLPPDMAMLNGKRHACMRFRLSAVKFTDVEVAAMEADRKKKEEEAMKKDVATASAEASSAPPPGPITAPKPKGPTMDAIEKASLKDAPVVPARVPGTLPGK